MTFHLLAVALAAWLLAGDPFSLFAPNVRLTAGDRRTLARGGVVSTTLDSSSGQVAVFAMSRVDVSPARLIEHARAIEDLKRSTFVTTIGRFSDPPVLADLDGLVLSPRDVEAALACAVGSCSFKLTAGEIELLRTAAAAATNDRERVIQQAFKRVVLARVQAYQAGGLHAVPPIANRETPLLLGRGFEAIVSASPPLTQVPAVGSWLRGAETNGHHLESFLYWSQENYGAAKPVVAVTHVALITPESPGAPAIVLGKQIFATRYMTGGLSLTAIATDTATDTHYLIYLNRTGVDLLGGLFGSFKRALLESRLKEEVPDLIARLRTRLERGGPSTTR